MTAVKAALLFLVLPACHWAGWKYYDPGTAAGAANDAALTSGLGGGAVCAEWAYDRDNLDSKADPVDAGAAPPPKRWLPKGWCEPPPGHEFLVPCDGGTP